MKRERGRERGGGERERGGGGDSEEREVVERVKRERWWRE